MTHLNHVAYAVHSAGNALSGCDDLSQGMSGRRDRQARTDQRDRPDRTEPALANEPIESIEASEPAEPIDRIEPADPIDRIDPEEPMDKMDPLEPMLKIDPEEPISRRETSLLRIGPFSQPAHGRPSGRRLPSARAASHPAVIRRSRNFRRGARSAVVAAPATGEQVVQRLARALFGLLDRLALPKVRDGALGLLSGFCAAQVVELGLGLLGCLVLP
jgi:hypothetical protein